MENTENTSVSTQEKLSFESRLDLNELRDALDGIRAELSKVIVGQTEMTDLLLAAVLAQGNVLIEGVPGIAKTLIAKLLARALKTEFSRIQFTPDLMPSDVLGTSVFDARTSDFEFRRGPVFSNIVLVDEINRAPAKTQAALFEVMEERQVTIDGTSYPMGAPFLVLATQNPIEQEGTYRLPEAQLDRFLFKIEVPYPTLEQEVDILQTHDSRRMADPLSMISPVVDGSRIVHLQQKVREVLIEAPLMNYIARIVVSTRNNPFLSLGASPRASIAMMNASKAFAAMSGRDFVSPEDIKRAALPVLAHRVSLTPEREMEGVSVREIVAQLIEQVEIPR